MHANRTPANPWMLALALAIVAAPHAARAQRSDSEESGLGKQQFVLRTYEVGDLVVTVPDYVAAPAGRNAPSMGGGGFGGGAFGGAGGFGGGGRGGRSGQVDPADQSQITLDGLTEALIACVAPDTWDRNGTGNGQVRSVGRALVVWQSRDIHELVADFLDQLRTGSGNRKTLAVDARWLFLDSDDLQELRSNSDDGKPQINREILERFTRRPTSLRGITNCFSGQLVYLISGTRRNVVTSYIPVVGSVERHEKVHLVSLTDDRKIVTPNGEVFFTQLGGGRGGEFREANVGYQPVVEKPNFGVLLELRPTLMLGEPAAVVDLKSTLTFPSQESDRNSNAGPQGREAPRELAPQVDRLAVQTLELATTLRVPLGEPVLAGGMTYIAPPAAADESEPTAGQAAADAEQRQLYLVLEIR